jgi:hypothetical protein
MPADLVRDRGYPEMTDDIRRMILGENFLGLHGSDSEQLKADIADDAVAQRQAGGRQPDRLSPARRSAQVHHVLPVAAPRRRHVLPTSGVVATDPLTDDAPMGDLPRPLFALEPVGVVTPR